MILIQDKVLVAGMMRLEKEHGFIFDGKTEAEQRLQIVDALIQVCRERRIARELAEKGEAA